MAKLTKKELKGVLKECLKEILQEEGILLAEGQSVSSRSSESSTKTKRPVSSDIVGATSNSYQNSEPQHDPLKEMVKNVSSEFSNPNEASLMEKIFADTATTTLMTQQSAGHAVSGGGYSSGGGGYMSALHEAVGNSSEHTAQASQQDEQELSSLSFQGDIGRWAKVAFAGNSKDQ